MTTRGGKLSRGHRAPDGTAVVEVVTTDPSGRRRVRPLLHGCRPGEPCHSPDGWNWGYGGSGPSELARWLLIDATGRRSLRERPDVYQALKRDYVSRWGDAWALPAADVLAWLAARGGAAGGDATRLGAEAWVAAHGHGLRGRVPAPPVGMTMGRP